MSTGPWKDSSLQLAHLALERLYVRRDIWGAYNTGGQPYTAPSKTMRGKMRLGLNDLINHFTGRRTIGAHCIGPGDRCLWILYDVDRHSDGDDAAANFETALRIVYVLIGLGLEVLIEDSDGRGGFHIWLLFEERIPSELAYQFVQHVKNEADAEGVESFPKQPDLSSARPFGSWVRIPGKHHKRDHWSRFYDLDSETWLAGADAVSAFTNAPLNERDNIESLRPILPAPLERPRTPATKFIGERGAVSEWTARFIEHGAGIKERNSRMFRAAADLCGCGYSQAETEVLLLPAVHRCVQGSGWGKDEALRTIKSAYSTDRYPEADQDNEIFGTALQLEGTA